MKKAKKTEKKLVVQKKETKIEKAERKGSK